MDKRIEEYIAKRKQEMAAESELENLAKKTKLLEAAGLGKIEYWKDYDEPVDNFPERRKDESGVVRACRYVIEDLDLSDEDYEELLKYVPKEVKQKALVEETNNPKTNGTSESKSGWYYFGVIMLILSCVVSAYVALSMEDIFIFCGGVLGSLIFFSQIILLSKIEYNTRVSSKKQ